MKSYKEFKAEAIRIKQRLDKEIAESEREIARARNNEERMLFRGEKTAYVIVRSWIEELLKE
ncbi:hypothetical protein DRH29_05520 [candidate division Kazan bacterium]|uniref:Uncharacterized protein n=1 Tax=candidate division Kazan bacterium TaxID=2202143 RepID=A0A420ZB62_UNCK3|nr:MAG: hypothetical protein DRH29_05520 [candidate division Kazan bacterium]